MERNEQVEQELKAIKELFKVLEGLEVVSAQRAVNYVMAKLNDEHYAKLCAAPPILSANKESNG